MSTKPWLSAYPRGVPAEIDPDKYASLAALFESSVERYGAAPAFSNLGETLTFADVDRLSRSFAAYLQSVPGLGPGERVAVMLDIHAEVTQITRSQTDNQRGHRADKSGSRCDSDEPCGCVAD